MNSIIQEIFRDNAEAYIRAFSPPYAHIKAINHICSCRTEELGAAVYSCTCGETLRRYHSCRDRHCPVCQGSANKRWADSQLQSSLPIKYFHIVFTLPDTLNGFVMSNPKESYNAIFKAAAGAILKLSADKKHLGATPGFTAVLHTWGQTMQFHPHLHVLITAGGLSSDRLRFIDKTESSYLFPIKALSKIYRGIFLREISQNISLDSAFIASLYKTDFSCHIEDAGKGDNVLMYLARYANRVCISDKRILAYDHVAKTVTFSYKDNKDGARVKAMTLNALEFIRRFLMHILPKRFMKIRHFGLLCNHGKFERLAQCRRLIGAHIAPRIRRHMPPPSCPVCGRQLVCPRHFNATALKTLYLRC